MYQEQLVIHLESCAAIDNSNPFIPSYHSSVETHSLEM